MDEISDAHLPRHQRQFPFRALSPEEAVEVRDDVNRVLLSVDDLLWKLARRGLPRSTPHADLDDIVQELRIYLAGHSLPRFNRHRGVKVSTFVYACVRNYLGQVRRSIHRRGGRSYADNVGNVDVAAPDQLHDRAVERLAERILRDPDSVGFTPAQSRAVKAVLDAPTNTLRRDISSMLGYASDTSFSNVMRKAYDRITHLDLFTPADVPESPV